MMKTLVLVFVFLLFFDPAIATNAPERTATIDYGDIRQGQILEPCVRIENTSSEQIRIQHVRPTCTPPPHFSDIVLDPGDTTVQRLPPIKTLPFSGSIEKRFILIVDPPSSIEVALQASCEN